MNCEEIVVQSIGIMATILAIVGRIGLAHKRIYGYICGVVCGILIILQSYLISNWSIILMCTILLFLDFYGLYCWLQKPKNIKKLPK